MLNAAARVPCPPRPLWHELPPLGSGIPGRIRSARPIPPRSSVTEFLPLRTPRFHIGKGELRPVGWLTTDRPHNLLPPAPPAAVELDTEFPRLAHAVRSTPRLSPGADLGDFSASGLKVPSVRPGDFSNSTGPVLPSVGSLSKLDLTQAPAQTAWQLTNTFFTPRRRIAQPEPEMRPLPAPQTGSRPVTAMRVHPTQMAGIANLRPWLLAELPKPVIPNCGNAVQEPQHQLSRPLAALSLLPRSVFQDTLPSWRNAPNSYVRRIEIEFQTEAARSITISSPLPVSGR